MQAIKGEYKGYSYSVRVGGSNEYQLVITKEKKFKYSEDFFAPYNARVQALIWIDKDALK